MTTKLGTRIPRKKRAKKKEPPSFCDIRVPAWLTRCATMGYEIWSEKPELRDECFRMLMGWETIIKGGFYLRLPDMDEIPMSSPLYLHKGRMRRVWLTINLKNKRRMTDAEITQASEEDTT